MAHVLRVGFSKLVSQGFSNRLCKITNHNVLSVAFISAKANRRDLPIRPPPFPYWKKNYNSWDTLTDPMMYRFDENTKIISVEGSLAIGKSDFAKELAEQLDMLYMPAPTFDDLYINVYNDDVRRYDWVLPDGAQSCDVERFLTDPKHKNVPMFQYNFFAMRFDQYMNALIHLLSTGQGVVLNRCIYSDKVFLQAMGKAGYISRAAMSGYKQVTEYAIKYFPRPHLFIYLDAPVNKIQEKIKKRNVPYEVNSKVLSTQYLTDIETIYKQKFLKQIESHSHVLFYDWTTKKDMDWIVHEIEQMDFEPEDTPSGKLCDWVFNTVDSISSLRLMCTLRQPFYNRLFPRENEMPDEFYLTPEELSARIEAVDECRSEVYQYGYNPNYQDPKDIMLSMKDDKVYTLRKRVRDFDYRTM